MKKLLIGLVLGAMLVTTAICYAADKVGYQSDAPTKVREVADTIGYFTFTTANATNQTVNFPKTTSKIVISNTDANALLINFNGPIAKLINNDAGFTTDGDNKLISQTINFTTLGVQVGDFVVMDEGDANDGIYYVVSIGGEGTFLTLNKNFAATVAGTADFVISSTEVLASTLSKEFAVGTKQIGVYSVGGTSVVKFEVHYQKER